MNSTEHAIRAIEFASAYRALEAAKQAAREAAYKLQEAERRFREAEAELTADAPHQGFGLVV